MRDASGRYELSVHPQGRTAADEYWHQGNVFIEGRDSSVYSLRFTNHTNRRVLAIFGVDGLCIQTGKPAGYDSPGYVIEAGKTIDVPGWSIDKSTAAEFYFSRKDDSYVNKIGGNAANAGVIGCMVFEEYANPFVIGNHLQQPDYLVGRTYSMNAVSTSATANASMPVSDVGTGIGSPVNFQVSNATFTRASSHPTSTLVIYYNSAKNLQRMGIQLRTKRYDTSSPNPFPGTYQNYGVTPPKDWNY